MSYDASTTSNDFAELGLITNLYEVVAIRLKHKVRPLSSQWRYD